MTANTVPKSQPSREEILHSFGAVVDMSIRSGDISEGVDYHTGILAKALGISDAEALRAYETVKRSKTPSETN